MRKIIFLLLFVFSLVDIVCATSDTHVSDQQEVIADVLVNEICNESEQEALRYLEFGPRKKTQALTTDEVCGTTFCLPHGTAASNGVPGPQGPQGNTGIRGRDGLRGRQGDRGPAGPALPYAYASSDVTQAITESSTPVNFTSGVLSHITFTNGNTFTVTRSGTFLISYGVFCSDPLTLSVSTSAGSSTQTHTDPGSSGGILVNTGQYVVQGLNSGDTIQLLTESFTGVLGIGSYIYIQQIR